MFTPTAFPYVRAQNYVDNVSPPEVLADEFYNPVQDQLAKLYGAQLGMSCSMACEDFVSESPGAVIAGAQFGLELNLQTATNAEGLSAAAIDPGDMGIWKAQNTGAGAHNIIIRDNLVAPGARKSIWNARVRFIGSAAFETVANEGIVVGMWGSAADTLPAFRWGTDADVVLGAVTKNWIAYYYDPAIPGDVMLDTGIELLDDTWYTLILTRDGTDNKIRYYIGTGTIEPTLVQTSTVAISGSISGSRRFMKCKGTGGSANGDGFFIDHYKRGVDR